MHLCMHIGLHKTGSTSFQVSAFNAAQRLAEDGVIYPTSGAFIEGIQHLNLANMIRRSDFSSVLEELRRLSVAYSSAKYIVLSSEELATVFADMDHDACIKLTSSISSIFPRVTYFGVARSEAELMRSGLREYIEAVGFPYDGDRFVATFVNDFFRRISNIQSRLPHLRWIDFNRIKGEHLASRLLSKMTSIDVDFDTTTTNRTADKTIVGSLLLSQLRLLHFNAWNEDHVYTDRIRLECEAVLTHVPINQHIESTIAEWFDRWLDRTLAKVDDERVRAGMITKAFDFTHRGVRWSTGLQTDHLR